MKETGYLLISDISGYTSFLSKTSIEHGSDVLRSLLNTIIEHTKPPLTISKLEGDAVFVYAPEKSFVQGQTLLEAVEQIYFAFKRTLEQNALNTTCDCDACRLMPTLDLKFVLHHGFYTLETLGKDYVELIGSDIIIVHRLLKNNIIEKTGVEAYLFVTQAASEAMQLGEITEFMTPHSETYDNLGQVAGYISDMQAAWIVEREQRRIVPEPEETWFTLHVDIKAPPSVVWDYLSEPELKVKWHGMLTDVRIVEPRKGRMGPGSEHHCSHAMGVTIWYFRDWRPYKYFTYDTAIGLGIFSRSTIALQPTSVGTRVSYVIANHKQPESNPFWSPLYFYLIFGLTKGWIKRVLNRDIASLKELVESDLASGKVIAPNVVDGPIDEALDATGKHFEEESSTL